MRILVCGDRNWTDCKSIENRLKLLPKDTIIIHGACRGADKIAGLEAKKLGFEVLEFPAEWEKYGKGAGPIRNQKMLDEGKPDVVIAFHQDIENSKGTKDMVERAEKVGIKVEIIRNKGTTREFSVYNILNIKKE